MITLVRAATAAAATLALPLPPFAHAVNAPQRLVPETLPIGLAVDALPLAPEDRTGCQRTNFKHWTAGDIPSDGCNARNEVLLREDNRLPPTPNRGMIPHSSSKASSRRSYASFGRRAASHGRESAVRGG